MKVTFVKKNCYCFTCHRWFHYLGIARHRAAHRDKKEDCKIRCADGKTYIHEFSKRKTA